MYINIIPVMVCVVCMSFVYKMPERITDGCFFITELKKFYFFCIF